ncbi:MAG: MoaF N-terminal domain-containing protein [Oscillospiraceae bacterium]|nr:MoaF N-terminal domain-containing protein [Oscillospiraceae bacterium]
MKNANRWYRKFTVDMSREEVERVVSGTADPKVYSHTPIAGPYSPPDSDGLVGKTLSFRGEERDFGFRFTGLNEVLFTEKETEEKSCFCNVKTLDNEIYFVNFLVPGFASSRQITLIADMLTGYATVCDAHIGTEYSGIDVDREFFFGRLKGEYAGGEPHSFTEELVGKAITWSYGGKIDSIKHIYNSNIFYTYEYHTPNGAWMAANPADYVKIRDGVYLFSFVEERQGGVQAIFLIYLDRMHDVGCFYGLSGGGDHLVSACLGAKGEMAPSIAIF